MRQRIAQLVGPRGRAMYRRLRPAAAPVMPGATTVARPGSDDGPRVLWPLYAPERYEGQLRPEIQESLAVERAYLERSDCDFYHSVDLTAGPAEGVWDLRGNESAYLGGLEPGGQRVLELGPASGGLTVWLEQQGASVVCVDAGFDRPVDLLPFGGADLRGAQLLTMRSIGAVQNAWWYAKRDLGLRASMVYAPIYELPGDLGRFDVAVFGAILLHLRRPFDALAEAARHTDRTIVVTDMVDPVLGDTQDAVVRFNPNRESHPGTLWWGLTPGAVVEFLRVLGFADATVTRHEQRHRYGHDRDAGFGTASMFTVVAHR